MKLVSGAIFLLAAEQAYAHSQLVPFANRDSAVRVFIPAALLLLVIGSILVVWGLLSDGRNPRGSQHAPNRSNDEP